MPNNTWIVSVLSDLDAYARTNDLPLLSEELTKAKLVAISEIGIKPADLTATSNIIRLPPKQH